MCLVNAFENLRLVHGMYEQNGLLVFQVHVWNDRKLADKTAESQDKTQGELFRLLMQLRPYSLTSLTAECGKTTFKSNRIVGGVETDVNEFPWQAWIMIETSNKQFGCGGTLISERWILTAAQCVFE